ncbi:hypothetical protein NIES4101_41840 [Calothrix sp. NIES-4101]|nr:hypothetical protein NIES4101_41840 [Calothrix sp. NIES-4101]
MSGGRGILLIALVIPGLIVMGSSLYSFDIDYNALERTEDYIARLSRDGDGSTRQLDLAYHRSLAHRVNAFTDGTWGFIGAAIAAIGIHGIVTMKEDDFAFKQDKKRSGN